MKRDTSEIYISTDVGTDGPMFVMGTGHRASTQRNMARDRFGPGRLTRVELGDAIEQGKLLCNMPRSAEKLRGNE
jgi:hypothetical protein